MVKTCLLYYYNNDTYTLTQKSVFILQFSDVFHIFQVFFLKVLSMSVTGRCHGYALKGVFNKDTPLCRLCWLFLS